MAALAAVGEKGSQAIFKCGQTFVEEFHFNSIEVGVAANYLNMPTLTSLLVFTCIDTHSLFSNEVN